MPPNPPFSSSGFAPDLAAEPDLARHLLRLAGDLCRRHVAGRRVHQVARPADGLGDDLPALDGVARRLGVRARRTDHHDAGERLLGLRGLVTIEPVRAEHETFDRRLDRDRQVASGRRLRERRGSRPEPAQRPRDTPQNATKRRRRELRLVSDADEQDGAGREPVAVAPHDQQVLLLLPASLASRYACSRPTSFTPGPASGPSVRSTWAVRGRRRVPSRARRSSTRTWSRDSLFLAGRPRLGERRSV